VTSSGRNIVIFHDLTTAGGREGAGGWFVQGP
jgi:hypothetical protein